MSQPPESGAVKKKKTQKEHPQTEKQEISLSGHYSAKKLQD